MRPSHPHDMLRVAFAVLIEGAAELHYEIRNPSIFGDPMDRRPHLDDLVNDVVASIGWLLQIDVELNGQPQSVEEDSP